MASIISLETGKVVGRVLNNVEVSMMATVVSLETGKIVGRVLSNGALSISKAGGHDPNYKSIASLVNRLGGFSIMTDSKVKREAGKIVSISDGVTMVPFSDPSYGSQLNTYMENSGYEVRP